MYMEIYFVSKVSRVMKRLMQAVRRGVPVGLIEGGNLDASLQHGNHSSTIQPSDLLLDRPMEDIVSDRVLLFHRSNPLVRFVGFEYPHCLW